MTQNQPKIASPESIAKDLYANSLVGHGKEALEFINSLPKKEEPAQLEKQGPVGRPNPGVRQSFKLGLR